MINVKGSRFDGHVNVCQKLLIKGYLYCHLRKPFPIHFLAPVSILYVLFTVPFPGKFTVPVPVLKALFGL